MTAFTTCTFFVLVHSQMTVTIETEEWEEEGRDFTWCFWDVSMGKKEKKKGGEKEEKTPRLTRSAHRGATHTQKGREWGGENFKQQRGSGRKKRLNYNCNAAAPGLRVL